MPTNRTFARDELFPSYWVNQLQSFIGGMDAGLQLTLMNATTVQVIAGAADAQVSIGITGKWRYVTSTLSRAHPGGAAGVYQIFAVTADNSVASTPQTNTDNTDYTFDLRIQSGSSTPTGVALFRNIGELTWDGAAITSLRQTVGGRANVGVVSPTSSVASESPVNIAGVTGQTAPLITAAPARGTTPVFTVSATGAVNASSFLVGGAAFASANLSDSGSLARLASPSFTGVPTGPTAAVDTNTTQLATTGFVVAQGYLRGSVAAATYAPLASPTFTGTPSAPTAAVDTSTTQLATTAFVVGQGYAKQATSDGLYVGLSNTQTISGAKTFTAPPVFRGAAGGGDITTWQDSSPATVARVTSTGVVSAVGFAVAGTALASTHLSDSATLARLASPTFTGTPSGPTPAVDTNTTQLATTAFVVGQGYAKLAASQTFTGTNAFTGALTAPTQAPTDSSTNVATTAFVQAGGNDLATLIWTGGL